MSSFGKRKYTNPVIGNHRNDVSKDWYIFFQFKNEGKVVKLKRREGVNRIKNLEKRLVAIDELLSEIEFDLKHGWNPFFDPKRENNYNPYLNRKRNNLPKKAFDRNNRQTKADIFARYFNK